LVGFVVRAVVHFHLARTDIAYGPQSAVILKKQAAIVSCGNLDHRLRSAGNRLQKHCTQQANLNEVSSHSYAEVLLPRATECKFHQ
jgi:hypothetical protein